MIGTTVNDYIKKAVFVRDNILNETEKIVDKREDDIIALNIEQIDNSTGSDGNLLKNTDTRFKGVYTLATQLMSEGSSRPKIAGMPYDFVKTGEFMANWKLDMDNSLTKFSLFSTGTGSGEKAAFFKGYKNLFGLDRSNSEEVNYKIILPELEKFIKKYL